jgi:iron complex transport system substrate-binding protein
MINKSLSPSPRYFIILILLVGCGRAEVSSYIKTRYVSLAPANTEILYSLGLEENIVGVTRLCDHPPRAKDKQVVGDFSNPSIEKIVSLEPDIIFATGLEQAPTVEKLKKLGLRVYVSDPSNFKELFSCVKDIGRLTGTEKQAENLINSMKAEIQGIETKVKNIPSGQRRKIFIEIWHTPLMTAGKGSFVDELIEIAGGINIAHDLPKPYSYISPEQVIKEDPGCIIIGYMEKEPEQNIAKRLGFKEIKAVKDSRVYNDVDPDLMLRPGPRLVEGLKEIHKRLYQ